MEMTSSTTTATPSVAADLEQSVKDHLKGQVRNFKVFVEAAGLVLRGTVRSFYAKQLAQHLVMEATSTPILNNDIEVVGRASLKN